MGDSTVDKNASMDNATGEEIPLLVIATGEEPPPDSDVLRGEEFEFAAPAEMEESPFGQYVQDCPVCKCAVRYFFLNFNERLKMCESNRCNWPFGYEEPDYKKYDDTLPVDGIPPSLMITRHSNTPLSGSCITTLAWLEMDKLDKVLDSDEPCNITTHKTDTAKNAKLQEVLRQKEAELQTKKNLKDIKKLNVQLQKTYEEEEDNITCIKNEKWIRHLSNLQSMSGVKLLKKEEMALLRGEVSHGLTMNIDRENISITIKLSSTSSTEVDPNVSTKMDFLGKTEEVLNPVNLD